MGLIREDMLALGIASGNFIFFKTFLATVLFGNLTATVFKFALAAETIRDLFLILGQM